jgi:hypothetical protein
MRHPWTGSDDCEAADDYRRDLCTRQEAEAHRLAELTGWELAEIRRKMSLRGQPAAAEKSW